MRDNPDVIIQFVKIVERYPEIYDHNLVAYKTRTAIDEAWKQITCCVMTELKEECTNEELRIKWKGIRSSYNRFRNKLLQSDNESGPFKKYYLYDTLHFLEPFTKSKSIKSHTNSSNFDFINDNDINKIYDEWTPRDVKPLIETEEEAKDNHEKKNKRKKKGIEKDLHIELLQSNESTNFSNMSHKTYENEDIQFFYSILPDIKKFTAKEKRKLKMGILKLIDDIDNEHISTEANDEVSST